MVREWPFMILTCWLVLFETLWNDFLSQIDWIFIKLRCRWAVGYKCQIIFKRDLLLKWGQRRILKLVHWVFWWMGHCEKSYNCALSRWIRPAQNIWRYNEIVFLCWNPIRLRLHFYFWRSKLFRNVRILYKSSNFKPEERSLSKYRGKRLENKS